MKNISGDLYISGHDETLTSTIKTPSGFKTEIEGTFNIVDYSDDKAGLTINNKSPLEIYNTRHINNVGSVSLLDDDQVVVFTSDSTSALDITLPTATLNKTLKIVINNTNGIRKMGSYTFLNPGSLELIADGTQWRIIGSHNQSNIGGTYYASVKIASDTNENFLNLQTGYTLNNYVLQEGDHFGGALAISGNNLAAGGARFDDGVGNTNSDSGCAYTFTS